MVTVPLLGATHEYHAVALGPFEQLTKQVAGSPASVVAPMLVPAMDPNWPEIGVPAKLSLGGGWLGPRLQVRVNRPVAPPNPVNQRISKVSAAVTTTPTISGIWMLMLLSRPPASISRTRCSPLALSLFASTQPAEPAPTTMKSN